MTNLETHSTQKPSAQKEVDMSPATHFNGETVISSGGTISPDELKQMYSLPSIKEVHVNTTEVSRPKEKLSVKARNFGRLVMGMLRRTPERPPLPVPKTPEKPGLVFHSEPTGEVISQIHETGVIGQHDSLESNPPVEYPKEQTPKEAALEGKTIGAVEQAPQPPQPSAGRTHEVMETGKITK